MKSILKKLFFGFLMFFCGLLALAGIVSTLESIINADMNGTDDLVVSIIMIVLLGWLFVKARAAFRGNKESPLQVPEEIKYPQSWINEQTKYKVKVGVSVTAIVFGIAAVFGPNEDLLEMGTSLILLGLVFTVGFVRSHNKKIKSQKEEDARAELEARIEQVSTMSRLPVVTPEAIVMRSGEVCHYQEAANVLQVKNEVVGHTSGSSGISVRVAKGVTLHSGGSRGHAIRQDVSHTYPGYFTITNQRIVMTGEKGFEHPLSKLTALTLFNGYEGITLQFGRFGYTVLMDEPYIVPKILELIKVKQE